MDEVPDVYADQLQLNTSAFGAILNFMATKSTPPTPGSPPETNKVATIRTSLEHLKVLTYIIRRQIVNQERNTGITYELPRDVLNALKISPEDWDSFWKKD